MDALADLGPAASAGSVQPGAEHMADARWVRWRGEAGKGLRGVRCGVEVGTVWCVRGAAGECISNVREGASKLIIFA